jgi:hypothetical protein
MSSHDVYALVPTTGICYDSPMKCDITLADSCMFSRGDVIEISSINGTFPNKMVVLKVSGNVARLRKYRWYDTARTRLREWTAILDEKFKLAIDYVLALATQGR